MAEHKTRLYLIKGGPNIVLVEAANPAQALRHVVKDHVVSVPTALEVSKLIASGVTPEKAGE